MLIGELSKQSGLSRDTIRYYEKRGLVQAPIRHANNYKDYSDDTPHVLLFIKKLQSEGFTLNEVNGLLKKSDTQSLTCEQAKELVQQKLDEIDEQIADLQLSRQRLIDSFSSCTSISPEGICTPFKVTPTN